MLINEQSPSTFSFYAFFVAIGDNLGFLRFFVNYKVEMYWSVLYNFILGYTRIALGTFEGELTIFLGLKELMLASAIFFNTLSSWIISIIWISLSINWSTNITFFIKKAVIVKMSGFTKKLSTAHVMRIFSTDDIKNWLR